MADPSFMSLEQASRAFSFLDPYLPPTKPCATDSDGRYPHLTLTYASSLDGAIALAPGTQTALSGPMSKAMTHYLRSRHDAILIGAGTAVVDDPALNCRLQGIGYIDQPRPVVLDPRGSWPVSMQSRVVDKAVNGSGKGVWILYNEDRIGGYPSERRKAIECGKGRVIPITSINPEVDWKDVLWTLAEEGIRNVMVEGGAKVINDLLKPDSQGLIGSMVITIAPVFLGKGSVTVSPERREFDAEDRERCKAGMLLKDVIWKGLGKDLVMCGRPDGSSV